MIKYKVMQVNKEVLADNMDLEQALMTIDLLRANNPNVSYDIEDYIWINPEDLRLGRDPDLH